MKNSKIISIYTALISIVYIMYGFIEVINGVAQWYIRPDFNLQISLIINNYQIPYAVADPFAGFVLIIIGCMMLYSSKGLLNEEIDGFSFAVVSSIFSAVLFILYLLIMFANFTEAHILLNDDYKDWVFYNDLNPAIVLFPLLTPLIYYINAKKGYYMKKEVN